MMSVLSVIMMRVWWNWCEKSIDFRVKLGVIVFLKCCDGRKRV